MKFDETGTFDGYSVYATLKTAEREKPPYQTLYLLFISTNDDLYRDLSHFLSRAESTGRLLFVLVQVKPSGEV